tara:strand:- start:820 stop:1302 length:483 start_codon:yes stop_codon:yes gene_type:complete
MAILKPIDANFLKIAAITPDDLLKNIFEFNELVYLETDANGSQITTLDEYSFFGINRILNYRPVVNNSRNKYSEMVYDCSLTFAKPERPDLTIETLSIAGQFDTITKELLKLDFVNTFKAYFTCSNYLIEEIRLRPIYNSTAAVQAVSHTGVEITFSLTI